MLHHFLLPIENHFISFAFKIVETILECTSPITKLICIHIHILLKLSWLLLFLWVLYSLHFLSMLHIVLCLDLFATENPQHDTLHLCLHLLATSRPHIVLSGILDNMGQSGEVWHGFLIDFAHALGLYSPPISSFRLHATILWHLFALLNQQ